MGFQVGNLLSNGSEGKKATYTLQIFCELLGAANFFYKYGGLLTWRIAGGICKRDPSG